RWYSIRVDTWPNSRRNRTKLLRKGEFELVGHADQINYRSGLHLLHHVAPVDFYTGLPGSDFGRNLLIEHSGDHKSHNLTLSCGQCVIALLQVVDLGLSFSSGAVTLEGLVNCVQQILVPERFRQKFNGARLQCSDGHGNVSMRRDKDDRDFHAGLGQLALEIESTHLRQPYIQNQTTRFIGASPL